MLIQDLWYKNAIIYCLDVETYIDGNGDGVGDFVGLMERLDYLAGLGVTCLWLQPFYPSPNRDNGYDVSDYYGIHRKHGSLGEFVEFMQCARQLGMRVIVDLVVSHTSTAHPWFQEARKDPSSRYRDWYIWSKRRPPDHDDGIVFHGEQQTTWTRDPVAGAYYFHRFYDHQPDLDAWNPEVREEIQRIMGFWLELGASGFRMDAVPFLIERKGAAVKPAKDFELLREMRDFLQWRRGDAVMLAEANVPPRESIKYFGVDGDGLQMMLNFPVNQRLFYAFATADTAPLVQALEQTYERPHRAQWVNFLRSHDELDLGRLTQRQRERTFAAFAPEPSMQLYGRGIRRRLAPMLGNDRRRIELAFSMNFSLPGTPMLQYGDEIGLGEDLSLPERQSSRTPMQWSDDVNGGFSTARKTVLPVIDDPVYGFREVNVASQRRDAGSLLNWMEGVIRMRKECPEISWGDWRILDVRTRGALVIRYDWRGYTLVTAHNFADKPCVLRLPTRDVGEAALVSLLTAERSTANGDEHVVEMPPFGYRWFRSGGLDRNIPRTTTA